MTQIKSEKAKEYIREHILDKKFNDGLDHSCVRAETAVLAIHYAEQEAEERAMKAHKLQCPHITNNGNCTCSSYSFARCPTNNFPCGHMITFINELNNQQ